ncbi:MAG: M20/M25/M40 family metallo-hydrolase, partial [Chloroflexi bacterium]|nr:M20/M25/M40 family metallo-hydrolase [Chloroflexota bacterium]
SYLVAQMSALGYAAQVDAAGNAVGVIEGSAIAGATRSHEIMLLGHIDTVPGFIEVKRVGDVLRGRGAVDAKGPLACFVAAGALAGAVAGRRITVIGAVGEEGDSRGAKFLLSRVQSRPQAQPAKSTRPAPTMLIIGEPSGWERVTLGYKGSAWFEFTARRALAHTSAQAESACEAAVGFWNRLTARVAEMNEGKPRMFDQLLPTLRDMQSGSDGFEEWARLKFGVRLPPGLSVAELGAAVSAAAAGDSVEMAEGVPAYRAEKNTPLVRSFLAAIRAEGGAPGFTVKSGTSDMNLVAPVWNCPTVAYGPGDSALDHTPDEHILVSEYQRAVRVLAAVLRDERLVNG